MVVKRKRPPPRKPTKRTGTVDRDLLRRARNEILRHYWCGICEGGNLPDQNGHHKYSDCRIWALGPRLLLLDIREALGEPEPNWAPPKRSRRT